MIRLTEDVASEIEARSCPAAVTFIFGLRLNLWPVFQKAMSDHVESVKKLAAGNAGYFSRAAALTETTVLHVRLANSFMRVAFLTCHRSVNIL